MKTMRVCPPLIAGKFHIGFRGLGVLGSQIPGSGGSGPGFGYPSVESDDADAELWFEVLTAPAGEFRANEDTSFTYSGPSSSFTFRKWRNGVDEGTAKASLTVGSAAIAYVSTDLAFSYAIDPQPLVSADLAISYGILAGTTEPDTAIDISKVSPSRIVVFEGSGSRIVIF